MNAKDKLQGRGLLTKAGWENEAGAMLDVGVIEKKITKIPNKKDMGRDVAATLC